MTREELYDKCENMEELYDNFYYPLLVENQELKSQLKGTTHCFDEEEHRKLQENYDRIYAENCKLREEHNINDISLLDENYRLKKGIDKAIEYIEEHSRLEPPEYEYLEFYNKSSLTKLLEILKEVSE